MNSLKENGHVEEQGLKKIVNNVNNSQEAIVTIRRCVGIIKNLNKKAIGFIAKQGELLKKIKDTQDF